MRNLVLATALLLVTAAASSAPRSVSGPITLSARDFFDRYMPPTPALSLRWGVKMEIDQAARTGSGGGTTFPTPIELSVIRETDSFSPWLMQLGHTGGIIKKLAITRGEMTIIATDVVVTHYSIQWKPDGLSDAQQREMVRFNGGAFVYVLQGDEEKCMDFISADPTNCPAGWSDPVEP